MLRLSHARAFRTIGASLAIAAALTMPASAKNDALRKPFYQQAGALAAEQLLTACGAINTLAEGWRAGSYEQARAAELAASYRQSATLALAMIRQTRKAAESAGVAEIAQRVVRQAEALERWVAQNDRPALQNYLHNAMITDETVIRAFNRPLLSINLNEDGMRRTDLNIAAAEAGMPPGRLTVYQPAGGQPFGIKWKYPDCTQEMGLAVLIPGTDLLGLSFGRSRGQLHVYVRDADGLNGGYVQDMPGTRGNRRVYSSTDKPDHFVDADGARLEISPRGDGFADIVWRTEEGREIVRAIAVIEGDAIAAVVPASEERTGVGIYKLNRDGTGGGRWLTTDGRNGTEELALRKEREPAIDTRSPEALAREVREFAVLLRQDLGNVARYRPGDDMIDAIAATAEGAKKLRAYVEQVYAQIPASGSAAKPQQTEIIVTGPSLDTLPGGYRRTIGSFREGIAIYGFKYVEPGKTSGMAYDGLIRIANKWVFIPKAWRAFAQ